MQYTSLLTRLVLPYAAKFYFDYCLFLRTQYRHSLKQMIVVHVKNDGYPHRVDGTLEQFDSSASMTRTCITGTMWVVYGIYIGFDSKTEAQSCKKSPTSPYRRSIANSDLFHGDDRIVPHDSPDNCHSLADSRMIVTFSKAPPPSRNNK